MKKILNIAIIFVFAFMYLFTMFSPVYAATPTFAVKCESPAGDEGVAQTKEVVLYYGVKDFTGFDGLDEKGINVFRGVLEYDTNIFEEIQINLTDEGLFAGYKTTTSDGNAPLQPAENTGWGAVTYNSDTKKFELHNAGTFVNTEMNILKVVLKVKGTAAVGPATVSISNIEAGNTAMDIYPSNTNNKVSKTVNIEPLYTIPIGPFDPRPDIPNFGGYIRIAPDTKVADVLSTNQMSFTTITNASSETLQDTDYVATGSRAKAGDDKTYLFIAVGDLDSNGKMSAKDLARLNALLTRQDTTLNDDEKRAADIRWDCELKGTDLARISSLIVGLGHKTVTTWYGTGEKLCIPVTR